MAEQELAGWKGLDDAITKLRALPPDRQALVLQGIDPAKKRAIQFRLNDQAATQKEKNAPRPGIRQFISDTAASEAKKAQQTQNVAEEPNQYQGGKYVGKKPMLVRAGNALLSLGHESANVVNQIYAGALDWKNGAAMLVSKLSPTAAAAFFASQGGKDALEAIQKGDASPENVQRFLLALATVAGSVGAAGEAAPAEGANINRAVETVKNLPKTAPELVRQGSQIVAGVGPERTTAPMVEEFKKSKAAAEQKQAAETAKTDQANRGKVEGYQDAKRESFRKEEEARAEHALETEEVKARNQAQQDLHTNRGNLARNINQGSTELGKGIQDLDKKVRAQGNEKYAAVRAKVSADEGVDIEPLADAVRHAKEKIIKGSPESIRQFHSIESREAMGQVEGEGADGGGAVPPDIWEQLDDAQKQGTKLKFDQLQGYSSEIGERLAKGGLQGDVYQALKHVKEAIDQQKEVIAGRNGASAELKAADGFWRNYMETFYDKPSAVAATLARVGKLDPEYYAEPFFGKAAKTSIAKLKNYDPDLASKAENLRSQQEEFKKAGGAAALRKGPKLENEPEPPAPGEPPKRPELAKPKTIEQPPVPTEADIVARKKTELAKEARNLGQLSRFDLGLLASSAIAPFIGSVLGQGWERMTAEAVGGPAIVGARRVAAEVLQKPKVMEWLAKPSENDLRILKEVNPDIQVKVKNNIRDFIRNQESHGVDVKVAPAVRNWLRISGTKLVKQGQEILKGEEGSLTIPGTGTSSESVNFKMHGAGDGTPDYMEIKRGSEPVGHLKIEQQIPGTWTVKDAALKGDETGKGYGKAAYNQLIKEAKNAGIKTVESDISMSSKARAVWESLKRDHPEAVTEDNGQYSIDVDAVNSAPKDPANLDMRLKGVNATIDAEGDTRAVDQARQDLGPNAKLSEVMRRAQDIKLGRGADQGASESRPGKPTLPSEHESEGEAARRGSPGELSKMPFLRRQLQSLEARVEHAATTGERMKLVEQIRDVEDQIKALEGKPVEKVAERSPEDVQKKQTRKMGQPRSE